MEFRDPLTSSRFAGDGCLRPGDNTTSQCQGTAECSADCVHGLIHKEFCLCVEYRRSENNKFEIASNEYKLVRTMGRGWPLDQPDKFYRISDQSRARFQNADFLSDFALSTEAALNSIHHLGPLRDHPKRIYSWSGETPESVGSRGEFSVAAILAASSRGRMLNRGPKKRQARFDEFIAQWLKDLGIIHSFAVKPLSEGRKEYEVLVKTHHASSEVKITDVGFGVSQVLPALVQAFYCPLMAPGVEWLTGDPSMQVRAVGCASSRRPQREEQTGMLS